MSIFVKRLQELLDEHNITYQELAKHSGVSRQGLCSWLKHKITPKTQSIIRIAKYFQCPIDFFLGRTDETKIKFNNNPVAFSERLISLIKEKNISQYRACMQMHIETAMMSDWTTKGMLPNYDNLLVLVDYFNCSADYLLGLTEQR